MTPDIETQLSEMLEQKAATIQAADLSDRALDDALMLGEKISGPGRRAFALAAAVLLVAAVGATTFAARGHHVAHVTPVASQPDASDGTGQAQAWPFEAPQPEFASDTNFRTPDAAARAYAMEVVTLPADWRLGAAAVAGDRATVAYVLQDVPATIDLARRGDGSWYVIGATTQLVSPTKLVTGPGAATLSLEPAQRTWSGVTARVSVRAADGRELATSSAPLVGSGEGAAPVVTMTWPERELPQAVRVDVMLDHDQNASTPDVVVGHWTTGIASPAEPGLPSGFVTASAPGLFSAAGTPNEVAQGYMRSRLPDFPAPDFKLEPAATRVRQAWVRWTSTSGIKGQLSLRQAGEGWSVVAAITDGVDMSDIRLRAGRLQGRVTTINQHSLFADVLHADGTPVTDAPRPSGMPDASYRFGTAGGPATGGLDFDRGVDGQRADFRVNLAGDTLLSVSEVMLDPASP